MEGILGKDSERLHLGYSFSGKEYSCFTAGPSGYELDILGILGFSEKLNGQITVLSCYCENEVSAGPDCSLGLGECWSLVVNRRAREQAHSRDIQGVTRNMLCELGTHWIPVGAILVVGTGSEYRE